MLRGNSISTYEAADIPSSAPRGCRVEDLLERRPGADRVTCAERLATVRELVARRADHARILPPRRIGGAALVPEEPLPGTDDQEGFAYAPTPVSRMTQASSPTVQASCPGSRATTSPGPTVTSLPSSNFTVI